MSMPETMVTTRVQALTARFAAIARPFSVDVAGVTVLVPVGSEAGVTCAERDAIPLTASEFAWLTVARESLNGQLDIATILRTRAVLPSQAQLAGIVLAGEHHGDPYFQQTDHPTVVVCAHPTPPVGKRPLLVMTPEEIRELFEAGAGAVAVLAEVKAALPGAHTFRVQREGVCRGEFNFRWQNHSLHLCDHGEEQATTSTPDVVVFRRNALPMFAALTDDEKEIVVQVFSTFPGATIAPPTA